MIGAIVVTAKTMGMAPALIPFMTGLLSALVGYGRYRLAPLPVRRDH